jgi:hypothetical protein
MKYQDLGVISLYYEVFVVKCNSHRLLLMRLISSSKSFPVKKIKNNMDV